MATTMAVKPSVGVGPETPNPFSGDGAPEGFCPDYKWLKLVCKKHGRAEWRRVACKRRRCEVCGPAIRRRQAERIAYGIRQLWPAAVLVLTFREREPNTCPWHQGLAPVADCMPCKSWAGSQVARFVAKLRRRLEGLACATTFEKHKSGVLHINLVAAPWDRVPLPELLRLWGRRLSAEWVPDERQASAEVHKRRREKSPDGLGGYMTKISQQVERGRSISFSENWPKLPELPKPEYEGEITCKRPEDGEVVQQFLAAKAGFVDEVAPGRYLNRLDFPEGPCSCFNVKFQDSVWDELMAPQRQRHWLQPHLDAPGRYKPGRGALS